jgi:hypothetical protein
MGRREYHISVVVNLVQVNCTMDMGNYTFTRDVYVLDRSVIFDVEQSKEVLTFEKVSWIPCSLKPSFAGRS